MQSTQEIIEEEEDPFAVFGDDDEEDDDVDDNSNEEIATPQQTPSRPLFTSNPNNTNEISSTLPEFIPQRILLQDDNAQPISSLSYWPYPLYHRNKDAWEIVSTAQYGRAVRATRELPVGTLLLIETPLWDITGNTNSATEILYQGVEWLLQQQQQQQQDEENSSILQYTQQLHPTLEQVERVMNNTSSITQTERDQILEPMQRMKHDERLLEIIRATQSSTANADMTTLQRYYLLLQYNLLRTGLYLYVALWNHQHQTPNCIKLGNQIWTCRTVQAQEMLTIDYVPEVSSRRAAIVWEHHKFRVDRQDDILPSWVKNYESVLQEFQEQYQLLKEHQHQEATREQHLEWAMALEQAILELLRDSSSADDTTHDSYSFLWIPCRVLYLQVGQYLLSSSSSTVSTTSAFQLTVKGRIALLERLLEQTQRLLQQQQTYHGPDHLHLATTYDELVQLCQYLVQQDPSTFYPKISPLEIMYRKQHDRIRALYPDVNDDQIPESMH